MQITKYNSPNFYKGRKNYIPDMIVCHITEGSYQGAINWLTNRASMASAHFVVSQKGDIAQLVSLEDSSWANGTSINPDDIKYYGFSTLKEVVARKTNANYYTVSIEHEGFSAKTQGKLTKEQFDATVWLMGYIIKELKRIYNYDFLIDRKHIVGHYEVAPKWKPNCPGKLFPFDDIIKSLKKINASAINNENIYDVTTTDIKFNGNKYNIERILYNNFNYIKLDNLKKMGFEVGYDQNEKIPVINYK